MLSSDGIVVLCHDPTLERYGHGSQVVEEMTAKELLSLDMGSWYSPQQFGFTPMMTLRSLLNDYADDFTFHIELKGAAEQLAEAAYREVELRGFVPKSVFTSFSLHQLERLRNVSRDVRIGWLVEAIDEGALKTADRLDLFQLCPIAGSVDSAGVERAHRTVSEVRTWGISGDEHTVRSLISRSIDAGADGLTINWPDWIRSPSPPV